MSGTQRLISVDSHYRVTVDQLKAAVPSRYRDAIDAANRRVEAPKLAAMQLRGSKPLGLGSYLHAVYNWNGITLTSLTPFEHHDKIHPEDTDGDPLNLIRATYGVISNTYTQEFRAA